MQLTVQEENFSGINFCDWTFFVFYGEKNSDCDNLVLLKEIYFCGLTKFYAA